MGEPPPKKLKQAKDGSSMYTDETNVGIVADVLEYHLLKGVSLSDKPQSTCKCFLVPLLCSQAVFQFLNDCKDKQMTWSLYSDQPVSARVALTFPTCELAIIIPSFPKLIYENSVTSKDMEEVDAVALLLTENVEYATKKNHIVYHVYDHVQPHASWKAVLKASTEEEHLECFELLKKLIRGFGRGNQVLNCELWSEAKSMQVFQKEATRVTDE